MNPGSVAKLRDHNDDGGDRTGAGARASLPMALIAEAAITAQRQWAGLSASWRWQIVRRGKPMGVRIDGGGFTTYQAARLAGSRALADFLEQVELESIRPGSMQAASGGVGSVGLARSMTLNVNSDKPANLPEHAG